MDKSSDTQAKNLALLLSESPRSRDEVWASLSEASRNAMRRLARRLSAAQ